MTYMRYLCALPCVLHKRTCMRVIVHVKGQASPSIICDDVVPCDTSAFD